MRWLGQAQRAFDLMCQRLIERKIRGVPLAHKQLMQKHVFDSFSEIQASRLLTLAAAHKIDQGEQARVEIGVIKVVGAVLFPFPSSSSRIKELNNLENASFCY